MGGFWHRKTKIAVNDAAYQQWLLASTQQQQQPVKEDGTGADVGFDGTAAAAAAGLQDDTPYPKSFAEIVELITTGKPIPGIKEIPDTILEAPKVQATAPVRKKPWELAAEKEAAAADK
jgi:hypothetical protein